MRYNTGCSEALPSCIRYVKNSPPAACRRIPRTPMVTDTYLPVLMFIVVGLLVGGALYVAGSVIGPHRPDEAKLSPYECGFDAFEDARVKFDVRYYLIAILFILFDL